MECREPLFLPGKKAPVSNPPSYRNGRYSPSTPPTPVQTTPNIPLPIPKNLVLLAMMEAAEHQAIVDRKAEADEEGSGDVSDDSDEDEPETFNLDKIIGSISTMSGPCGTYAVVERNGLIVLSRDPRKDHHLRSGEQNVSNDEKKDEENSYREPMEIKYGQKVQVVELHDGVATLARGQGFVIASMSGQLAKGT